jgi:hypothetical protein
MFAVKQLKQIFAKSPAAHNGDVGFEQFVYHASSPFYTYTALSTFEAIRQF